MSDTSKTEEFSSTKIELVAGAVVVAAGASSRMNGLDKLFMPILGKPLIFHTLSAIHSVPEIREIVFVLSESNFDKGRDLVNKHGFSKVNKIVIGGKERQDSVKIGLEHLALNPWIVIHDGARPCVEPQLIREGIFEAVRHGSAVAAVPVKETIKVVNREGIISKTLERDALWAVQTPQVFSWDILHRAYLQQEVATDDSTLVEHLGERVHIYPGSYNNIKVTTSEDSVLAELYLKRQKRVIS